GDPPPGRHDRDPSTAEGGATAPMAGLRGRQSLLRLLPRASGRARLLRGSRARYGRLPRPADRPRGVAGRTDGSRGADRFGPADRTGWAETVLAGRLHQRG